MRTFKFYRNAIILSLLILVSGNTRSQNAYSLKNHLATINGTSNIRDWSQKIGTIWGICNLRRNADNAATLQSFKIGMQVNSIKSEDYPIMNSMTFKALKGDQFPEITFNLAEPVDSIRCSGKPCVVVAKGRLTIAGVTREITMPMKFVLVNNEMTVEVEQQVKMSEYGITPPTALFGLIKTGNIIMLNCKTTFLADKEL